VGSLALAEVLLNHAGIRTNLEILDEPTRNLSVEGIQDLSEYLGNRAKQLDKDIFFVDHHAREGSNFDEVITIVKTKDGSHLEM
jgi:ABC-type transport system involved in cytochrome bd biosynthesis fused ATPase/permease subunit